MSEKHIDLKPGDTLIVHGQSIAEPEAPAEAPDAEELDVLLTIGPVAIYALPDGSYVHFMSDLDVCTDGTGDHHGDKTPLNETAYYSGGVDGGTYLNADKDKYLVIPPQIRSAVGPVVMGCMGRVTNMQTGVVSPAVCGEIGPQNKTGECAICLAQILNPKVSANAGDSERKYLYELWPGKPAVVDGFTYKLQPA